MRALRPAAALAALLLLSGCASVAGGRSAAVPSEQAPAAADQAAPGQAAPDLTAPADLVAAAGLEPCPPSDTSVSAPAGGLPAVVLPCLGEGPDVALAGLRGQPTLVNVWASWCLPCQREAPHLQALAAGGRVRVLGVVFEDSPEGALGFAREAGVRYPSVLDHDGVLKRAGVVGPPVTYFVDDRGRVVARKYGEFRDAAELRRLVREHLGVAA